MQHLLFSLIDPRGRCNRKGLLVAALVLLAVEIAAVVVVWLSQMPVDHPALLVTKAALMWVAIAAACQRLHDLGRSAWLILPAMLGLLAWSFAAALATVVTFGPDAAVPGTFGFWLVFAAVSAPMLAALLWLHFAPGQPHANNYGPQPDGLGFAGPQSRSRRAPSGALPV